MIVTSSTAANRVYTTNTQTDSSSSSASFEAQLNQEVDSSESQESLVQHSAKSNEEIIAEYRAKRESEELASIMANRVENFLAKHEEEFREEYEFYDKYKEIFTPRYSNYTREKAENIARELNAQFPDYKTMRFNASHGGTEADKVAFEAMFIEYQAFNSYLHEKYDLDFGLHVPGFSPEGARAYNYTVYEQLEMGMSIEKATEYAQAVAMTFGGKEASAFQMMGLMGYPEDMEAVMATPEAEKETDYSAQIDLRDHGIDHNFWFTNYELIFGTDKEGIKQRISYELDLYTFLKEHEALVDSRLEELSERSPEWFEWRNENGTYVEGLKESFKSGYEVAKLANMIYEKYSDRIFKDENPGSESASTEEVLHTRQALSGRQTNKEESSLEKVLQSSA